MATSTIELPALPAPAEQPGNAIERRRRRSSSSSRDESGGANRLLGELAGAGSEPCSTPAVRAAEKWNEPRRNPYRLGAAFWCFLVMGANDAAYGALIPYLEADYHLGYVVVSLVFLSPLVGYVSSAMLNNRLHHRLGRRGVAAVCGASHLAAYAVIAAHPPYAVLVFAFILAGFGNGVADAAWNAWVGSLANSSELLGFLRSFCGVGGVVSPLVATTLVTKANMPWHSFYYIMIGLAGLELAGLPWAFWDSTGAAYRAVYRDNEVEREAGLRDALFRSPAARLSWVAALFLLCYVGVEVALGGWIVVFMLRERHGEAFASGMSAVGFWLGITVGRAVLGFVTPRMGVKLSSAVYIGAAMALELVFWLVPQFYVSAVAVSLQGFFLGPLFPNAVLAASKLLPRHQHVVVIGFAAAFGGCGAAVLPFLTGILAQSSGVTVLQPVVLSLLGTMLVIWLCLPRTEKKEE
ncbi:Bypass of stop codon protein 6 [Tolypocladium ophioglossoides CBS 100239]|uniref:Bypass of stop codon protein 6 n=1 Tax=Tolypocladium ophioglossoides (strain CBS 100239) TaxID=1163406 RepID=A0A0L0NMK2_TOLOC|nr:Bypass of stop codon protein 6 [Tolypocladium ophioglossoides CBS 100239]